MALADRMQSICIKNHTIRHISRAMFWDVHFKFWIDTVLPSLDMSILLLIRMFCSSSMPISFISKGSFLNHFVDSFHGMLLSLCINHKLNTVNSFLEKKKKKISKKLLIFNTPMCLHLQSMNEMYHDMQLHQWKGGDIIKKIIISKY